MALREILKEAFGIQKRGDIEDRGLALLEKHDGKTAATNAIGSLTPLLERIWDAAEGKDHAFPSTKAEGATTETPHPDVTVGRLCRLLAVINDPGLNRAIKETRDQLEEAMQAKDVQAPYLSATTQEPPANGRTAPRRHVSAAERRAADQANSNGARREARAARRPSSSRQPGPSQ